MVRRLKSAALDSRNARLDLKQSKKPRFESVGQGLSVGYRRTKTNGTWIFRKSDGKGGMSTKAIGVADDYVEADGETVLSYWQAVDKVRELGRPSGSAPGSITVKEAFDNYLPTLEAKNARSAHTTKGRVNKHILPRLGTFRVVDLTKTQLDGWKASLVKKSDDKEAVRKSKDSANRVLSMLKAFLNHACDDEANAIPSDQAWRKVKPFKDVARPREVRFSPPQAQKLINTIEDAKFARLVEGGYATGGRYEELTGAKVAHFDGAGGFLTVSGKTGSRPIILQTSAVKMFSHITAGRPADAFIFEKKDGARWKPSDQVRPMKKAIQKAKLDPKGCFYALRHAYISEAIEENVPLTIIADNCGTSVRMIEQTYAKVLSEKKRKYIEQGAPKLQSQGF
ncbi:tyrosine-type recombinase/integrase [Bradyrhizobium sp. AUGA SZCCT0176]|uniref:tyrosine-type recombinase/integrase n=1 Tax=Bradyrhizobium sp. AUGA SZCCT0176 TaxID=2807664 RepID=UPI001BA7DB3C|nr:tyrosine-type recombinase/integrase [Bradyrhizobium sp. AUGA SZCCT0176]MBR1225074.1 tyrosine-type recombinase/integrase [Bradyrhizobium sp. AUGA SZCCT0176]